MVTLKENIKSQKWKVINGQHSNSERKKNEPRYFGAYPEAGGAPTITTFTFSFLKKAVNVENLL